MVNNLEKHKSINYVDYYNMSKLNKTSLRLLEDYKLEYDRYNWELSEWKDQVEEFNTVLRFNNNLRKNAQYATDPYDPKGWTWTCKPMPRVMEKPLYMDPPIEVDLYEYYEIEEFNTSWMLNISPNWKGATINQSMIDFFKKVIDSFFNNCERFTKVNYVLENGHGRDHLHAHCVFELNTKKPGYMTSIKKGNILTEWRNCWNRLAKSTEVDVTIDDEFVDVLDLCKSKYSLNTCLLNNQQMYQDKLDYLCENLKPESHKNDSHPLCPIKGSLRV